MIWYLDDPQWVLKITKSMNYGLFNNKNINKSRETALVTITMLKFIKPI